MERPLPTRPVAATTAPWVDLASDLGEGMPDDDALLRLVTTAHVSCGRHAGGPELTAATIALARRRGVTVSAHPGYDDPANFGRVPLALARPDLVEMIRVQLVAFCLLAGGPVAMVKAHGALYNQGERDAGVAGAVVEAILLSDASRRIVATPGSAMALAATAAGLDIVREGFVDRAYEGDGTLRSRRLAGAVHADPAVAAAQAVSLVVRRGVTAHDGTFVPVEIDTLCVHGDSPRAVAIARATLVALAVAGVVVRPVAG